MIEKLTEKLMEYDEYARIYECGGEGGSIEVEPFAVAAAGHSGNDNAAR